MWFDTKNLMLTGTQNATKDKIAAITLAFFVWIIITVYFPLFISCNNWGASIDERFSIDGNVNFIAAFILCVYSIVSIFLGLTCVSFIFIYTKISSRGIISIYIMSLFLYILLTLFTKESLQHDYVFRTTGGSTGSIDLNRVNIILYSLSFFISVLMYISARTFVKIYRLVSTSLDRKL